MRMTAFFIEVDVSMNDTRPRFDDEEIFCLRERLREAIHAALTEALVFEEPASNVTIAKVHVVATARWNDS